MSYIICLWTTSVCSQSVTLNFSLDASKEKVIHTIRRSPEIIMKTSVAIKGFKNKERSTIPNGALTSFFRVILGLVVLQLIRR